MSIPSKSRPLSKNSVILDLYDDIFDFFKNLFPDEIVSHTLTFLAPMKALTRNIQENSRNSQDLWKNMKTVTLLQQLQRDMYERFEEYFGSDYIDEMILKTELDKLSERLTVVYTDMMNDLNHKAHARLSNLLFELTSL